MEPPETSAELLEQVHDEQRVDSGNRSLPVTGIGYSLTKPDSFTWEVVLLFEHRIVVLGAVAVARAAARARRQAELEIALEFGGDLGVMSDWFARLSR